MEAARAAARGSAIVGFHATSNVEAAREFDLRVNGTMAHSFITAFDDEREAFRAFAEDHPHRTTFLVDTYDTLNGVRNAIEVIEDVDPPGEVGVRLDSGDLDRLSREARRILDHAGLGRAKIFASGGLDEHEVAELVRRVRRSTRSGSGPSSASPPMRRTWTSSTSSRSSTGDPC